MDKITKERMDLWERRLEGGLDSGDVADILDDWATDVERYESLIEMLANIDYENVVVDTDMEEHIIGYGKEYANKEDWIANWIGWVKGENDI